MLWLGRSLSLLGLLFSVMALSSLVYGAFTEPLEPYLQGIMGGVMEYYREFRDAVFGGLGVVVSGLINWLGALQWFGWLPESPWFQLNALARDLLLLYAVVAGTFYRVLAVSRSRGWLNPDATKLFLFWSIVFWPLELIRGLLLVLFGSSRKRKMVLEDFLAQAIGLLVVSSATMLFFLLAYGENRLGL